MTQQKPPGVSWESWIDQQIREAREAGAFDNLPGAGKPIPNLGEDYDPLWWVKQLAQREQISMLPPALELLRKVETQLAAIKHVNDEGAVRQRIKALNVEIGKVNATAIEGPPTRLGLLFQGALQIAEGGCSSISSSHPGKHTNGSGAQNGHRGPAAGRLAPHVARSRGAEARG